MELTINVQVGVSPEVAELVRKAVAIIMSVRQSAEKLEKAELALRQEDDSKERTPLGFDPPLRRKV